MINIQNIDDNEYFKWCLVRHLHPTDHNPASITKVDEIFCKIELDFKDIKSPVKIRKTHKIDKKRILSALAFLLVKTK